MQVLVQCVWWRYRLQSDWLFRSKYWRRRENCVNRQYHHQLPSFFKKTTSYSYYYLCCWWCLSLELRPHAATQNTVTNYVSGYYRELCERSCDAILYYAIWNSCWNSRFVKGQSPPLPAIGCCRRSYTDCSCTMDATRCTMNVTRWVLNWASSLWQLPTSPPCTPIGCCALLPTTVQLNGLRDGFQLNVADMTIYTTGVLSIQFKCRNFYLYNNMGHFDKTLWQTSSLELWKEQLKDGQS